MTTALVALCLAAGDVALAVDTPSSELPPIARWQRECIDWNLSGPILADPINGPSVLSQNCGSGDCAGATNRGGHPGSIPLCASWSHLPVNPSTGELRHTALYLPEIAQGDWLSFSMTYANQMPVVFEPVAGNGWFMSNRPYLKKAIEGSSTYYVAVLGPGSAVWFLDAGGGSYTPRFGEPGATLGTATNVFVLTLSDGVEKKVIEFHDHTQTSKPKGQFKKYTDDRGTVEVTFSSGDQIQTVERSVVINGSTYKGKFDYDYFSTGEHAGLIEKIRSFVYHGGSWKDLWRIEFLYHGSTEVTNGWGNMDDLKYAGTHMWDETFHEIVGRSTFRYYTSGFKGLKYFVGPESYRRIEVGVHGNPKDASQTVISDWADAYYEYDSNGYPTKVELSASCSSCGGGGSSGTMELTWSENGSISDSYRHWKRKCKVETKSGSDVLKREVIYSNEAGQILLQTLEEHDGLDFIRGSFYRYTTDGLLEWIASPKALDLPLSSGQVDFTTLESFDDLLDEQGGNYSDVKDSAGLIAVLEYYTSTTATESTNGGVAGFVKLEKLKNGETATAIKLREYKYTRHSNGSEYVYPVAEVLTYPDESTSDTAAVTFEYEWFSSSNDVQRVTTKSYVVENSTSSQDKLEGIVVFDAYGNQLWSKDPKGLITYFEREWGRGRLKEVYADADTDRSGFSPVGGVPSGFTNTSGEHRQTSYLFDEFGRSLRVTGPAHNCDISGTTKSVRTVHWNAYDFTYNLDDETTRSASGFLDGSTYTLVGGISVEKLDRLGRSIESWLTKRDSTETGEFNSDENVTGRTRWRTWSKSVYSDDGQLSETHLYHLIPSSGAGSQGTNYEKTLYAYDALSRTRKVTDPLSKSSWTFHKAKTVGSEVFYELRQYPHVYQDGANYKLSGPVSVSWTDAEGHTVRSFLATCSTVSMTSSEPNGTDTLTALSRSTTNYDWRGRVDTEWQYFELGSLTESQAGTKDTNYYETDHLAYNNLGQVLRVKDGVGDISATVYDALGRSIESWAGTVDTGATRTNPGAGSSNLVKVSETQYGSSGTRKPYVTKSKSLRAADTLTYGDVDMEYDVFGAQTWSKPQNESDGGPWQKTVTNAASLVTESLTYKNNSTSYVLLKSETIYEGGDRVKYQRTHETDGSGGTTGKYLETKSEYDDVGRANKETSTSGAYTLTEWDHAGRVTASLLHADANTVVEESTPKYDAVGTAIETVTYSRNHNAGSYTGKLSADATKAQRRYQVSWCDHLRRPTHGANFGTNGGSSLSDYDPGTSGTQAYSAGPPVPNSSDDVIVEKTTYDARGQADEVTDNLGRVTKHFYDDLGRLTHKVDNFKDGSTYWVVTGPVDPDQPKARASDVNRIAKTVYDANSKVMQQIHLDAAGNGVGGGNDADNQVTRYVYSAELTDKGTPTGGLKSNSLLRAVIHADSDDSVSGSALQDNSNGYDREEMTYYTDGTLKTKKDQRATELTYVYYPLGELKVEKATTLGGATDGAVRTKSFVYDDLRRELKAASHSDVSDNPQATTNVLNQIQWEYNGLGQITKEYQEHSGVVSTSTSLKCAYTYDTTVSGSRFTKSHRLKSITYPSGQVVNLDFGTSGSISDVLNRTEKIKDDAGTPATLIRYDYVGSGETVTADYEQADVRLDYYGGTSGHYPGLDRFGRVLDQRWIDYGSGSSVDCDRFEYRYDRGSNRLCKAQSVSSGTSTGQAYQYDELQRLKEWKRGVVNLSNATIASPNHEDDYTFDLAGNWMTFDCDDDGDASCELEQARACNAVNEIDTDNVHSNTPGDSIGLQSGGTGANWIDPVYDAAGNMIEGPKPGAETTKHRYTYDAWNRMVNVEEYLGSWAAVLTSVYDACERRVRKTDNAANPDVQFDYYYNTSLQMLEVRKDSSPNAFLKYIWHSYYADALAVRLYDQETDGGAIIQYLSQDANINSTSTLDSEGVVLERSEYDAYGRPSFLSANFTSSASSICDASVLFAGHAFDAEAVLNFVKLRHYHPTLGRWLHRDPLGAWGHLEDVGNSYGYAGNNPISYIDSNGAWWDQVHRVMTEHCCYECGLITTANADIRRLVNPIQGQCLGGCDAVCSKLGYYAGRWSDFDRPGAQSRENAAGHCMVPQGTPVARRLAIVYNWRSAKRLEIVNACSNPAATCKDVLQPLGEYIHHLQDCLPAGHQDNGIPREWDGEGRYFGFGSLTEAAKHGLNDLGGNFFGRLFACSAIGAFRSCILSKCCPEKLGPTFPEDHLDAVGFVHHVDRKFNVVPSVAVIERATQAFYATARRTSVTGSNSASMVPLSMMVK